MSFPAHPIQDADGYLFFSQKTRGFVGRPVKIHASLFMDFLCAVSPSSSDGQMVIRDIESLTSTAQRHTETAAIKPRGGTRDGAKHKAQLSKIYERLDKINRYLGAAAESSLITKNVRVYFHTSQKPLDKYPTVYISEIQVINRGRDMDGGRYEEKAVVFRVSLNKVEGSNLTGDTVFISAAMNSTIDAMERAKSITGAKKPTLFFNPLSVTEDLTFGKQNRLTTTTQKLVDELGAILRDNQSKAVNWTVEGEGAALLSHALSGKPLSLQKHCFEFINPKADLPKVLQQLAQSKAQLPGEVIHLDASNSNGAFASVLAMASQKNALMQQLAMQPPSPSKIQAMQVPDQILRLSLIQTIARLGGNRKASTVTAMPNALPKSNTTFIDALKAARS